MASTFKQADREARALRDYWSGFGYAIHTTIRVEEMSPGTLGFFVASDLRGGLPPDFKRRDYQIFADETPVHKPSRGYRGRGYSVRVSG